MAEFGFDPIGPTRLVYPLVREIHQTLLILNEQEDDTLANDIIWYGNFVPNIKSIVSKLCNYVDVHSPGPSRSDINSPPLRCRPRYWDERAEIADAAYSAAVDSSIREARSEDDICDLVGNVAQSIIAGAIAFGLASGAGIVVAVGAGVIIGEAVNITTDGFVQDIVDEVCGNNAAFAEIRQRLLETPEVRQAISDSVCAIVNDQAQVLIDDINAGDFTCEYPFPDMVEELFVSGSNHGCPTLSHELRELFRSVNVCPE